ncbi:MAG: hypothetical protein M1819_007040 [Sarea resinae]|nr:MAG: hypothetical protein M1819_007040 [Sarea resinae]
MGLPIFREPEDVESKVTTKGDPSAASRSAIRRQRTVRYPHGRNRPSSSSTSSQRQSSRDEAAALVGRRSLFEIIHRDRAALTPSRDASPSDSGVEIEGDRARTEIARLRQSERGRDLLREVLRHHVPRRGTVEVSAHAHRMPPPLPPVPEPRDYSHSGSESTDGPSFQTHAHGGTASQSHMPTPPYSSSDRLDGFWAITSTSPPLGSASLTPRFAPAHPHDDVSIDPARLRASDQSSRRGNGRSPNYIDFNELPPLRRMGHRSITEHSDLGSSRPFHDTDRLPTGLDGLGDRERSISPEDDSWETLLTTIAPDSHMPNANSASTSTSTSADASTQYSNSSSNSLLTTLTSSSDALEPFHICDGSSDSEEDSETEGDNHGTSDQDGPPVRDPGRYSANVRHRAQRAGEIVDEYLNRITPPARDRADRAMGSVYEEFNMQRMPAILSRLARREHVPDEWWTAAGLDPNFEGRNERASRERL